MDKKKLIKVGIIVVIIIIVIALTVVTVSWIQKEPIRVVKKFITAVENDNYSKLEKAIDLNGWYAWHKSKKDIDEFFEEYKNVSEDDIDELIEEYGYSDRESVIESFLYDGDNVTYKIINEPTIKKIGKDLYKVRAKLKINDDGYKFNEKWEFIIYRNKIVECYDIS